MPHAMMLTAVLLAAPCGGLLGQAPSAEQAVRQAEDRRIKATIEDDFATLEAVLADDLTYGHSNGVVDSKASYLEALRSGKTKYLSIDRAPSVVRIYGETAIVTGTATVGLRSQPAPFTLRYTLAYVMRDGQWRMVAWQSTRLP
jgi:hypothetical protein